MKWTTSVDPAGSWHLNQRSVDLGSFSDYALCHCIVVYISL